jgi:ADP-ribosylation factor 1/2
MFFENSVPTIGLNIEQINFKQYALTFWDVGGQATKLWKHYFDSIDMIMFVVDSNDRERLPKVKSEVRRVLKDKLLEGVPVLFMFNK